MMNKINNNIRKLEKRLRLLVLEYNRFKNVDGITITFDEIKKSIPAAKPCNSDSALLFQRATEEKCYIIEEMKRTIDFFDNQINMINTAISRHELKSFYATHKFKLIERRKVLQTEFNCFLTPVSLSIDTSEIDFTIDSEEEDVVSSDNE